MPVQCTGCGKQLGWGSAMTSSGDEKKNVRGESAFTKMLNAGSRYTGGGDAKSYDAPTGTTTRSLSQEEIDAAGDPRSDPRFNTQEFKSASGDAYDFDKAANGPIGKWSEPAYTYADDTSTSDGNAKRSVSEGTKRSESGMSGALGALNAVTYDYKDPERDGWGKHAGIIAQDAQTHPIAALMVEQDPHDGRLVLDNKKALSFSLAAAADLDKRMRAVEGKRRT